MADSPIIRRVILETVRNGSCEACGDPAVRARTFAAPTYFQASQLAEDWDSGPLLHLRCEADEVVEVPLLGRPHTQWYSSTSDRPVR